MHKKMTMNHQIKFRYAAHPKLCESIRPNEKSHSNDDNDDSVVFYYFSPSEDILVFAMERQQNIGAGASERQPNVLVFSFVVAGKLGSYTFCHTTIGDVVLTLTEILCCKI
ncbi:hypothetical protein AB6A40_002208 [Gnathostoma spinigerum]|uniref:Uncharacterized protein n=1 Tax=Gnathostoma spinigerum TaxID=75299 RepID=A0ABD6EDR9_9BILA